jgi:hypothetical protein
LVHQRCHNAVRQGEASNIDPYCGNCAITNRCAIGSAKKRRTEVRLLLKLHSRCHPSLHNEDIVSEFTSERIEYNLV